jgi:hypothetical protein
MALTAAKSKSPDKAQPEKPGKVPSAADRIQRPPFGPTGGITRAQIRKVIREIAEKRAAAAQG